MASLDSQGEIVLIELPNPEDTQIWECENQSVRSRQRSVLKCPVSQIFCDNVFLNRINKLPENQLNADYSRKRISSYQSNGLMREV